MCTAPRAWVLNTTENPNSESTDNQLPISPTTTGYLPIILGQVVPPSPPTTAKSHSPYKLSVSISMRITIVPGRRKSVLSSAAKESLTSPKTKGSRSHSKRAGQGTELEAWEGKVANANAIRLLTISGGLMTFVKTRTIQQESWLFWAADSIVQARLPLPNPWGTFVTLCMTDDGDMEAHIRDFTARKWDVAENSATSPIGIPHILHALHAGNVPSDGYSDRVPGRRDARGGAEPSIGEMAEAPAADCDDGVARTAAKLVIPVGIRRDQRPGSRSREKLMKYYSAQSYSELLLFERGAIHALNT